MEFVPWKTFGRILQGIRATAVYGQQPGDRTITNGLLLGK
jgi:hypothetical protein